MSGRGNTERGNRYRFVGDQREGRRETGIDADVVQVQSLGWHLALPVETTAVRTYSRVFLIPFEKKVDIPDWRRS